MGIPLPLPPEEFWTPPRVPATPVKLAGKSVMVIDDISTLRFCAAEFPGIPGYTHNHKRFNACVMIMINDLLEYNEV